MLIFKFYFTLNQRHYFLAYDKICVFFLKLLIFNLNVIILRKITTILYAFGNNVFGQ